MNDIKNNQNIKNKQNQDTSQVYVDTFSKRFTRSKKYKQIYNETSKKRSIFSITGTRKEIKVKYSLPSIKNKRTPKYIKVISNLFDTVTLPIRRMFSFVLKQIILKGNHERSILIFYKNEEASIKISVTNFVILFFISLISLMVFTGINAYDKQKASNAFYESLSAEDAKTYSMINEYRDTLAKFAKTTEEYSRSLRNLSSDINYTEVEKKSFSFTQSKNKYTDINIILDDIDKNQKVVSSFIDITAIIRDTIPIGWPVTGGGRVTSVFGYRKSPFTGVKSFHSGIDIASTYGTQIVAVADGVVVFSGWRGGYGWFVLIEHKHGYQTGYGHNSKLLVDSGAKVKRGQVIALMGNTGRTTGIHSHFEVRISGEATNPRDYLNMRF